ncbi:amidase [soil metagenome]
MTELHELDAHDQAAALQRREVSAVELINHHLARVDAYGAQLGAFITVTADQARARAVEADERRASGGDVPHFLGVPTAIKDLNPTDDAPTTYGSLALRGVAGAPTSYSVRKIEAAGFISLGKTNTPEFGLSAYTDNYVIGPARTPWDLARNAGGSSGGAAAAVAAGLVPVAHGSDGGGSIRIPSSACGIFGFKPSRGRVDPGPSGTETGGLAVQGPLARTVRDAAAYLDVMAETELSGWVGREPGRMRIGRFSLPAVPGIVPHPDSIAAWEAASELLESLGHEVEEIANPFSAELEPQFNIVWSTAIASLQLSAADEDLLRPNTSYWRGRGRETSGIELYSAMAQLELLTKSALSQTARFDAYLTPTLGLPPQELGWFNESGDPREDHRRELLFTPFTAVYNMSGQPAASLPLHWSPEGLPIGVMLAGRPQGDGPLLSLCAQVEAAHPWVDRRPRL